MRDLQLGGCGELWRRFPFLNSKQQNVVSTAMSTLAGLLNNTIHQDKLNITISKCPANDSSNNSLSKLASVMGTVQATSNHQGKQIDVSFT